MSILTESQFTTKGKRAIPSYGKGYTIRPTLRFDDQCGNGHNTFSLTADIYDGRGRDAVGGCCHDEIVKAFPELAPFVKWHLCSTDGPMHYIANTLYYVEEHGPNMAWLEVKGEIAGIKTKGMVYGDLVELRAKAALAPDQSVLKIDEKTAKIRNLDHARVSACWPDATDEDLTAPGLKGRLEARLPKLMEDFRRDMESLGFVW